MPVSFAIPKSPKTSVETMDEFLGADFTNSPANVDPRRSPNLKNMVRSVPGKVRKSLGWSTIYNIHDDTAKVNGCHHFNLDVYGDVIEVEEGGFNDGRDTIYHIGTKLYYYDTSLHTFREFDANDPFVPSEYGGAIDSENDEEEIIEEEENPGEESGGGGGGSNDNDDPAVMNDHRSMSWQLDQELYILDGKTLWSTHGSVPKPVHGRIPLVTISKDPNGGGTSYEDLNLIQPGFTEQFLGQANVVEYQLSFTGLDATEVEASILNANGTWTKLVENTGFTVNRQTGVVTFTTAPGVSPVTGEDNVKITAFRTVNGYEDRIYKCTFGIRYGVNGNDRLFLSGNPEYPGYVWYSEPKEFGYFPDTS